MQRMRGGLSNENHSGERMNIAVFASGKGSNFSAVLKAAEKGIIKPGTILLVCDTPGAPVLEKAKKAHIPAALFERKSFRSKQDFEQAILRTLKEYSIDLIVLAGFMRMLSPEFVRAYKNRILNIHPSLLPAFKGAHGIKDAFEYGVTITGVTVHFVDEKMDNGPIILQEHIEIKKNDTLETLEKKIHTIEHILYPRVIKLFIEKRLKIKDRKVIIR